MEVALVALKRGDKIVNLEPTVPDSSQDDDDGYVSEDEHLHNLETSGQMQHVIGSQSMLSQEIHRLEAPPPKAAEESQQSISIFNDMGGAFSQQSIASTDNFDSQQLAHQYGLLSQDPAARATVRTTDSGGSFGDSQGSRGSSQGGFGTLLDAVSMFQSQEEEEEKKRKIIQKQLDDDVEQEEGTSKGTPTRSSSRIKDKQQQANNSGRPPLASTGSTRSMSTRSSSKRNVMDTPQQQPAGNSTTAMVMSAISSTAAVVACDDVNMIIASKENTSNKRSKKPPTLPLTKNNSNNIPTATCNANQGTTKSTTTIMTKTSTLPPLIHTANTVTKPPAPAPTTAATNNRKRKRKDDTEAAKQAKMAQRAADLAQRTINDPELAKRLLLSMALTRENPRSAPEALPGPGHVLPEGFFWAHYPPLEKVLKDNMAEYYELSITKCQSAQQQSFNNTLVELVRAESNRQGWLYAPCFTDKNLRDRIRCYYKTHIQNAKKRLRTMVKNPTKRANARHLCSHLDMIEKNVEKNAPPPTNIDPQTNAVITHQDWGSAFAGNIQDAAQAIVAAGERAASFEARVEASVAVATKTIRDEAAKKMRARPDLAASSGRSVVPLAVTNPAAAALAPDALTAAAMPDVTGSMMPPDLVEASREKIQKAVAIQGGDPIAAEAAMVAMQASGIPPIPAGVASPAQQVPAHMMANDASSPPPKTTNAAAAAAIDMVSTPAAPAPAGSPVAGMEITSPVMMI